MVSDLKIFDDDRVSVVDIDDTSNDSTLFSCVPTRRWPIDDDQKRKMEVSSKVPAKKLKSASSCSTDSVENIYSRLTKDEVISLFKTANISSTDYEFLVPLKGQRANRPPEGYIAVYAEQINAGLRFPLHDMVVRVCNLMRVSPSQLVPNAHRIIVGFIVCAKLYEIPLTEGYFFSLFYVTAAFVKGFFQISPKQGNKFLDGIPSSSGSWKRKFFFLRRKGNSFNCITKWSTAFSRPTYDASLAKFANERGIMDHHFRVCELTSSKEILVHGGIEPGVPSPELTFRYLMYKAAITKFVLLPDDLPQETKIPSIGRLSAPKNPATAAAGASLSQPSAKQPISRLSSPYSTDKPTHNDSPDSDEDDIPVIFRRKIVGKAMEFPAQPSARKPIYKEEPQSSLSHIEVPSSTFMPIRKDLPDTSKDSVPVNDQVCKKEEGQATKLTLPISDEKCPSSIPPHLLVMQQALEMSYVPKESYQKLENDSHKLASELELAKSRIRELELELALSKAKEADFESRTSRSIKAIKSALEEMQLMNSS